jgi:hypothetical protein
MQQYRKNAKGDEYFSKTLSKVNVIGLYLSTQSQSVYNFTFLILSKSDNMIIYYLRLARGTLKYLDIIYKRNICV